MPDRIRVGSRVLFREDTEYAQENESKGPFYVVIYEGDRISVVDKNRHVVSIKNNTRLSKDLFELPKARNESGRFVSREMERKK